jgi:hypothetical protein
MVGCMGSWRSSESLLLLRLSSHGRSSMNNSSSSNSSSNSNSARELKESTSDGRCKWAPQSGRAYRSSSSSLTGHISPLPLRLPPLLQAPPSVSGYCSVNKANRA